MHNLAFKAELRLGGVAVSANASSVSSRAPSFARSDSTRRLTAFPKLAPVAGGRPHSSPSCNQVEDIANYA